MAQYYRIQPAGLDVKGHYSETSNTVDNGELADGLHVLDEPWQIFFLDGYREDYGDEVVVIESDDDWENGDVEGVCIDPETAVIVKRYTWEEWLSLWRVMVGAPEETTEEDLKENYDLSDFRELP